MGNDDAHHRAKPANSGFIMWLQFTAKLEHKIEASFFKLGEFIAERPCQVIWSSLFFALILCLGLGGWQSESDTEDLWVPLDSPAAINSRDMGSLWTDEAGGYYVFFTVKGAPAGDTTIFSRDAFLEMNDLYEKILAIEITYKSTTYTYRDLCLRPSPVFPHICYIMTSLDVWKDSDSFDKCLAGTEITDCDYAVNTSSISASPVDDVRAASPVFSWLNTPHDARVLWAGLATDADEETAAANDDGGGANIVSAIGGRLTFATNAPNCGDAEIERPIECLWSTKFLELLEPGAKSFGFEHVDYVYMGADSVKFELARSMGQIEIVLAAILMMVGYCVFSLGKCHSVKAKKALAGLGVFSVIVSCCAALGFCNLVFGIPRTPVTQVVFFLSIGIGVDDMYVIVNAYEETDSTLPVKKRLPIALSHAGSAVMMTSVTDFIAFLCGSFSQLPAIKWYCINLAFAVIFDFMMQVTFFVAVMACDAYRQEKHIYDCCCIKACSRNEQISPEQTNAPGQSGPPPAREGGPLFRFLRDHYGKALASNSYRIGLLGVFAVLLAVGSFGMTKITADFTVYDVLPYDSHLVPYFKALYSDFIDGGIPTSFVISRKDYDYGAGASAIVDALDAVAVLENTLATPSTWLDSYAEYLDCTPCCSSDCALCASALDLSLASTADWSALATSCDACRPALGMGNCTRSQDLGEFDLSADRNGLPSTAASFEAQLPGFLVHELYGAPRVGDVVLHSREKPKSDVNMCDETLEKLVANGRAWNSTALALASDEWLALGCGVRASRMTVSFNGPIYTDTMDNRINAMLDSRAALAGVTIPVSEGSTKGLGWEEAYIYHGMFLMWEQFRILFDEAIANIATASIVVYFITLVMLGHPRLAIIILACLVGIDVTILGYMPFWGVQVNVVSVACLVLAVGLSVDYCVHIAHVYNVSKKSDRVERTHDALTQMGVSVIMGAFTTLLGIIPMGFANSPIMVLFFRMFVLTILFGGSFGVLVLPVLLIYFGPILTSEQILSGSTAVFDAMPNEGNTATVAVKA